jgi:HNH endonuclease
MPGPPFELDVVTWDQAYALFWSALGDGRSEETFANSLKNARDNYDSHIESGRIGWMASRQGEARNPQPLSQEELRVVSFWEARPRGALWRAVSRFISDPTTKHRDEQWREGLDDPDQREEVARRVRRGQTLLRARLLQVYGSRCAVTGDGPQSVLEAAHIQPHATAGWNRSTNAILLRADLHCLFDDGLVRIEPTRLEVHLDASLKPTSYWSLRGRHLAPRLDGLRPDLLALKDRWESRRSGTPPDRPLVLARSRAATAR